MAKQKDDQQSATRQDVKDIVTKVVSEIVGDVAQQTMGVISKEFTSVKKDIFGLKQDVKDLKATTNRIENKLDGTVDKVDDHEVRIKRLEKQPA